eukprot:m.260436 g.260436  ORF g.260436 m.260436 type:complete len:96 (-) comp15561_c0_seq8:191-478(-)
MFEPQKVWINDFLFSQLTRSNINKDHALLVENNNGRLNCFQVSSDVHLLFYKQTMVTVYDVTTSSAFAEQTPYTKHAPFHTNTSESSWNDLELSR